jgi:hypothetical protein
MTIRQHRQGEGQRVIVAAPHVERLERLVGEEHARLRVAERRIADALRITQQECFTRDARVRQLADIRAALLGLPARTPRECSVCRRDDCTKDHACE